MLNYVSVKIGPKFYFKKWKLLVAHIFGGGRRVKPGKRVRFV